MEAEVRALVEGQMMAKRAHADKLGMSAALAATSDSSSSSASDRRILVCGGASVNRAILQVVADVFNAPVFTRPLSSNVAALGAAWRARQCVRRQDGEEEGAPTREDGSMTTPVCVPHKDAASVNML